MPYDKIVDSAKLDGLNYSLVRILFGESIEENVFKSHWSIARIVRI